MECLQSASCRRSRPGQRGEPEWRVGTGGGERGFFGGDTRSFGARVEAGTASSDGTVCVIPGRRGPESLVWRQLEEAAVDSRARLFPASQLPASFELFSPTYPVEI